MSAPEFDPNKTAFRRAVETVVGQAKPKSTAHGVRVILGGVAVLAALGKFLMHNGPWARDDALVVLVVFLVGMGVIFTDPVVAIINALTPWQDKKGQ